MHTKEKEKKVIWARIEIKEQFYEQIKKTCKKLFQKIYMDLKLYLILLRKKKLVLTNKKPNSFIIECKANAKMVEKTNFYAPQNMTQTGFISFS